MSLPAIFLPRGPSGFSYGSTAEEVTAGIGLDTKTILLTGCNSGLGRETLRILGLRGAHVIAAARSEAKAQDALDGTGCAGTAVACDLSKPKSVRACLDTVSQLGRPIDAVICNAGIMALPTLQRQHGYELQFFTNHIGHFILVNGVLPLLTDTGRVVMVSSDAHRRAPAEGIEFDNLTGKNGYSPWRAYGQSKLANLLFAKHLDTRLEPGQSASALHPGVIRTNLMRHMNVAVDMTMRVIGPLFFKTIPQGAATQCYLATHPQAKAAAGQYFADCNVARPSKPGLDPDLAEKLWHRSEEIVAQL